MQDKRDQMLLEKINELKQSNKSPQEQVQAYVQFARELAEMMGYTKEAPKPIAVQQDPTLTLEIEKLRLQSVKDDREFQWKMEESRREWDLKMEEFKDNGKSRKPNSP